MNDFRFFSPSLLLLLALLPVARFVLGRIDKGARNRLLRFVADANLEKLLVSKGTLSDRGKRAAFWAGLALAILAAARPQANPTVEEVQSSGLDIYVLMDVSRSMDAEDIAPSRLLKAKKTVQHLTARLAGDRVGVIAYANSAVLITPLTSDYSIIDSYLKNIDTSLIPSQGTNLGSALEVAKDAMERGAKAKGEEGDRSNIFVVLSDGEDHGDSDLSIVDEIRKNGGLVFAIAFGTERGAPIPLRDEKGELRGFKTDLAKNTVVSPMKPQVLKEVANRGGGTFYFSTYEEAEVEDLLARVGDAQRGSFAVIHTTVYEELFPWFLAPALALLLFSFVSLRALAGGRLPGLKDLKAMRSGVKPAVKQLALLVAFLPLALAAGEARAHPLSFLWTKEKNASEESRALAKEKKYDEAVNVLKGLQAENPDNADLAYNMGTYMVLNQKHSDGREQLKRLASAEPRLRLPGLYNAAGSYALEQNKAGARAEYAELIQLLSRREKLSDSEAKLLADAKRNVARLADPNQQPPPQQDKSENKSNSDQNKQENKGGSQGQNDQKKQEGKENKSGDDKKDDKGGDDKKDNKGKGDDGKNKEDKKDKDKENKEDGEGKDEKKDSEKKGDEGKEEKKEGKGDDKQKNEGDQGKQGGQLPPRRGGQPFKERDNMGEDDAKRILGALKEREGNLQKKFLKDKVKGGKVTVDDAAKDW